VQIFVAPLMEFQRGLLAEGIKAGESARRSRDVLAPASSRHAITWFRAARDLSAPATGFGGGSVPSSQRSSAANTSSIWKRDLRRMLMKSNKALRPAESRRL